MQTTTTHEPIDGLPRVVTADELKQIDTFNTELEMFRRHVLATARPIASAARDAAVDAYRANPNDETFRAMRSEMQQLYFVEHETGDYSAAAAEAARDNWIDTTVMPFVRPLAERVLAEATHRLDAVRAEESKRHEALLGAPATAETSVIVAAAQRPVDLLKENIARLDCELARRVYESRDERILHPERVSPHHVSTFAEKADAANDTTHDDSAPVVPNGTPAQRSAARTTAINLLALFRDRCAPEVPEIREAAASSAASSETPERLLATEAAAQSMPQRLPPSEAAAQSAGAATIAAGSGAPIDIEGPALAPPPTLQPTGVPPARKSSARR